MSDFGNFKNLLETAQRVQAEMARVKIELAAKTVSGESGGGLVACTANGKGDLLSVSIDPSLLAPDSRGMVQDLLVGAVNQALDRARELAEADVARVTAGLPLPPGIL